MKDQPRLVGEYDVLVIGCGMAGLSAGLRAAELDRSTAVLEKAPEENRGGNTQFTAAFRIPTTEVDFDDLGYPFVGDDYTPEDYYDDLIRVSGGKADEELSRTLVEESPETVEWLTELGLEWVPFDRPWNPPGMVRYSGEETVERFTDLADRTGVDVHYDCEARSLRRSSDGTYALDAIVDDERARFRCGSVVLASGGYEANEEKRVKYIDSGYDQMKVRGSRYNTGEAIDMAIDAGAKPVGQWGGAHICIVDSNTADFEAGVTRVDGYQYGVIVNHDGDRFLDEGEDEFTKTYAKFGEEIFEQPNNEAFVVIDSDTRQYVINHGPSDPATGATLSETLAASDIDDPESAVETIEEFNRACSHNSKEIDQDALDGKETRGLSQEKSNWAVPIDSPPFYCYPVTGGITFSYGGVEIDPRSRVISTRDRPVPGLYAAGNCTGGLFYDNYPGGAALMSAAVFGKIAAEEAAEYVDGSNA